MYKKPKVVKTFKFSDFSSKENTLLSSAWGKWGNYEDNVPGWTNTPGSGWGKADPWTDNVPAWSKYEPAWLAYA